MAASISNSIPAQNALPAPVTITTREWLFSIASSALCSSAIIWVLMALRLSGRFSVILAISPLNSRIRVEYMAEASLIQKWRMRIFHADFVGHGQHLRQSRAVDAGINAVFASLCYMPSPQRTVSRLSQGRPEYKTQGQMARPRSLSRAFPPWQAFPAEEYRRSPAENKPRSSTDTRSW